RALSAQIAPARLRVRRLPDPALVPQGRRAESASPRSTPLMRRRWPSGHALALLLALVVIAALTVIVASPLHRTFYLRFRTERITAGAVPLPPLPVLAPTDAPRTTPPPGQRRLLRPRPPWP